MPVMPSHSKIVVVALVAGVMVAGTLAIASAGGPLAAGAFYAAVMVTLGEITRGLLRLAKALGERVVADEYAELQSRLEALNIDGVDDLADLSDSELEEAMVAGHRAHDERIAAIRAERERS